MAQPPDELLTALRSLPPHTKELVDRACAIIDAELLRPIDESWEEALRRGVELALAAALRSLASPNRETTNEQDPT